MRERNEEHPAQPAGRGAGRSPNIEEARHVIQGQGALIARARANEENRIAARARKALGGNGSDVANVRERRSDRACWPASMEAAACRHAAWDQGGRSCAGAIAAGARLPPFF
jgi:hypothetical protein